MAEEFTQHGARSRGLVLGIALMLLVESAAIHAFLLGRPWWIHLLLFAANASTIWFLWAHDRAIGMRPVRVGATGIDIRHGLLISAAVGWTQLDRVTLPAWKELPSDFARGYLKASGFDDPNVLISLREPLRVRIAPGIKTGATQIGLRLDDPAGFVRSVSAHSASSSESSLGDARPVQGGAVGL